jgi:hypothetical protein
MSEIPQARPVKDYACEVMFRGRCFGRSCLATMLSPSSLFELRRARFAFRLLHGRATRSPKGEAWWSQTGSNRRPHACKARALPAELWPRTRRRMPLLALIVRSPSLALRRSSLRSRKACRAEAAKQRRLVGLGRLELPTSRLSSARSNQLSYKPPYTRGILAHTGVTPMHRTNASPWRVFVREERETKTAKSRQWSSTILKLLAPDVSKEVR